MQHRTFWLVLAASIAAYGWSFAAAQTPSQMIEQLQNPEVDDADPTIVQFRLDNRQAPPNARNINFDFGDIALTGADDFNAAGFEDIWAPFRGQTISIAELYDFRDEVQRRYREAGYPFSRVTLPTQDIGADGVVSIHVIEAFVDRIVLRAVDDEVYPAMRKICAYATRLIGKKNTVPDPDGTCVLRDLEADAGHLSLRRLERVVLLINDLPGIQATAVPTTGNAEVEGAIDLIIRLQKRKRTGLDFFANNRQADIVGPGLVGLSGRLNSYTRFGDSTEISYLNSFDIDGSLNDQGLTKFDGDTNERRTVQFLHRHFFGDRGGEVGIQYLFSHTEPGDELAVLDFAGDQHRAEIGYTHPILRQQGHSLWLGTNFAITDSEADVSGGAVAISDDRIRTFGLKATYLWRGRGIGFGQRGDYLLADVELRQGLDVLNASEEGEQDISRFDGVPDFTKLAGTILARRNIPAGVRFNSRIAFQYATDPVLAPEEFAVGGAGISRAFDPAELTGDRGAGVLGELERPISMSPFGWEAILSPYVYGDYGFVANISDEGSDSDEIISAGGGFRVLTQNDFEVNFEVGVPINQPLSRTGQEHARFFVSVRKSY